MGDLAKLGLGAELRWLEIRKKMRRTSHICNRLRVLDNARALDSYR